eukprot:GFUD01013832.1.p1 GENE.GFUD01013832.1~~GFUD01013832.1.p1  ORF type:complete len:325 (+),score=126.77 GFUD01013832.1:106-1080(+)
MGANQSTRKITVVNDEVSGVIKISDAVVQRLKGEISGETSPAAAPKPAPAPTPEPKVEAPPPPPPVEVPPPPPVAVEVPPPPPVVVEVPPPPPVAVEVPPPPPIVELPPPPPIVEVPPPPPIVEVPPPPPIVEIPPPTPIVEVPPPPPPVELSPPPPVEVPPPPPVTEPSPPPPVPEPVIAAPAPVPAPAPAALPPVAPAPSYVWQRPIIQYIEEPSLSALRVRAEKEEELKKLEDYWKDRLQKQEENHIANAKLTEEQILKSANHVETLFKPASSRDICRDSRLAVQTCYSENPSKPLLCREKVLEFSNCVSKSRLELLTPSG